MRRRLSLAVALLCLLLLPVRLLQAQMVEVTTFEVAVGLYDNGNYAEAATLYEQLIAQGYHDSRVYYNLGNAYYKQNDFGEAILNYRRALQLRPRDSAARENLARARGRVTDQLSRDQSVLAQATGLGEWLTTGETALMALVTWIIWATTLFFYRRPRSERQRTALQSVAAGLTVGLLLIMLGWGYRIYDAGARPDAVVIAEEVAVLAEPSSFADTLFTLHSGAEVEIVERRAHWVRLTLPGDELQGWAQLTRDRRPMIELVAP